MERRLEKLHGQMRRFSRRADTLLERSRLASHKHVPRYEPDDLSLLVAAIVDSFQLEAAHLRTTLTATLPSSLPGEWDTVAVDQIVSNLISNALKYGGSKPVEVHLELDGAVARLSVRDQGSGISAEDLARVFERFERLTSTRQVAGFGVGLWVIRQLVESSGGEIAVSSRVGQGSTFTVTLP